MTEKSIISDDINVSNLRPANEDDLGLIIDEDHQFNSLEEAGNYVQGLKDKLKRRASLEEFPITTAMPEERQAYLNYGISLLTRKNLPFTDETKLKRCRAVLYLLTRGYTYNAIIGWLRKNVDPMATIQRVRDAEREGIKLVKDAIAHVKNNKVPILGGK